VSRFLDTSDFPAAFNDRTMDGPYALQHASDMVRLPCLYKYGGVWMDVSIMLFLHLDDICWTTLLDNSNEYEVAVFTTDPCYLGACNWFIGALKGSEFIRRWSEVFREAWQDRTNCVGISSHPLFDPCHEIKRHLIEEMSLMYVAGRNGHTEEQPSDYLVQVVAFASARLSKDPKSGFDGQAFSHSHIFVLDNREAAGIVYLEPKDAMRQFTLLKMSCEYNPAMNDVDYAEAKRFCDELLHTTAFMKLYHYTGGINKVTLAGLWDMPENENADNEEGTFARWLREGPFRVQLSRRLEPLRFGERKGVRCGEEEER
jgi:hypothetical protein